METQEFIKKIQDKEIDIVEHTHDVIRKLKKINKEYHFLNTISEESALKQAEQLRKDPKGKLCGVAVSIKDSVCVKGIESTAGSSILKGYKPLFDATAVENIKKEGGIIIGKTSQDAFGFGSFSVNVGQGFTVPLNPIDKDRSCGGSSGGAGGLAKKADFPHIALGESTGGSIACPASFCGVYGLCPTYGRVSRYGLIDYGNSLDKLGPLSQTLYDSALFQEVISGYDKNDSTSIERPVDTYTQFIGKKVKGMKIGVIKESFKEGVSEEVSGSVWKSIKQLESNGVGYDEISMELPIKHGLAAYYMIGCSEASTNLAKYCGMRYGASEKVEGSFNEYFTRVRSKSFNEEAKRRIILGTFARMSGYRDAYYIKALQVRTKIVKEYQKMFKKYDALVSPTVPVISPKFSDIDKMTPLEHYMMDVMLVGPNLAGMPHINIPSGEHKKMPIGTLLIADHFDEAKLIQLGTVLQ